DVTQTAPRVALALRQSIKNKSLQMAADSKIYDWQAIAIKDIGQKEKSPLFVTAFAATKLDDVAARVCRAGAEEQARIGFAVAHCIDPASPAVEGLDAEHAELAAQIAAALLAANIPLVVSGTGALSHAVMQASANIVVALHKVGKKPQFALCVPEVNSLGLSMMGGGSLDDALALLSTGAADGVVIVENDITRRADSTVLDASLSKAKTVVVVDHQQTPTVARAHFVLPAGSFAEGDGTIINMEGRAQRYFQLYNPNYYDSDCLIHESWRWLYALHTTLDRRMACWTHFDDVTQMCADNIEGLQRIVEASPNAAYRVKGLKIARAPRRYSGRAAMRANVSVHEPRVSQDEDSALTFSMEGSVGPNEDASFVPFAWAPGWNSPQAWTKFQDEVGGHLRSGDAGVRMIEPKTSAMPYFSAIPAVVPAKEGQWRVAPCYHIFGSEELSVLAPAVKPMVTGAYVALHSQDAAKLGLRENNNVNVVVGNRSMSLRLKLNNTLQPGSAGLPVGLAAMPPLAGTAWVTVAPMEVA
ncbi:MAG: molybdopterin-dependent oxidoreductase, partial [Pseudomonadales bacterium]|nr:molybdopterin-dependent oxidoreductase [Pseudomonadales bacterium]